jgi:hypothetical protein
VLSFAFAGQVRGARATMKLDRCPSDGSDRRQALCHLIAFGSDHSFLAILLFPALEKAVEIPVFTLTLPASCGTLFRIEYCTPRLQRRHSLTSFFNVWMEVNMRLRTRSVVLAATMLAASLGLVVPASRADDDKDKGSTAGASFGRGLNTAQPGNKVNHIILPRLIKIKTGGVVNFTVAGFHDIIVFKPGFTRADLEPFIPAAGPFIFPRDPATPLSGAQAVLTDMIFYRGINPAGAGNAPTGDPVNASNRSEVVAFLEPGTYFVHCNVRGHLLDGMYAYVKVSNSNDD